MGVYIAAISILSAIIFSITLIVITALCLKDKKHNLSICLNKKGFQINIKKCN